MSDQRPPTDRLQPQSNEKTAEHVGAPSTKREGEAERKKLPQLGALEDDDEFEVRFSSIASFPFRLLLTIQDFPPAGMSRLDSIVEGIRGARTNY
jgi:hypothetical protein